MALGVYVLGDDVSVVESVTLAIERSEDVFVAPTMDRAEVVLAAPGALASRSPPDGAALVVLADADPLASARAAIARSAHGILGWPEEAHELSLRLREAAARRRAAGRPPGRIISIVAARGGAGASTVGAYVARELEAVLVDLEGGPAGQALYAPEAPAVTLTELAPVWDELTPDALERAAAPHAAGVRCLYGGSDAPRSAGRLASALRGLAPIAVVDGFLEEADVAIRVIGPDVGSVRCAAQPGHTGVEFVLNRARRDGVRADDAARALGSQPLGVVPYDPRIARAADLGRFAGHGRAVSRLRRLARSLASRLENAQEQQNEN
jgi:Flp pilus assembly CpaE family ATPase